MHLCNTSASSSDHRHILLVDLYSATTYGAELHTHTRQILQVKSTGKSCSLLVITYGELLA
jgi:hypothetical protein